ncbi:hypothetical protein H6G89_24245 [Oscillatoria sp. FACHB-1407]|uniref:hypothetical protein n=1 Tax=Oscillatoria sp. FACHB-1407 TaxID=2692847 RepID=UPI001687B7E1|nr:hypothetical protein [Oscillatoria sp. FACHB-1407]MBD2464116.1 hypothetical protein [Oscillatoria sp. FACHB-1407]
MLYLAQVHTNDVGGKTSLKLLAQHQSEHAWAVLTQPEVVYSTEASDYNEGTLVLVELSSTKQIKSLENATPWLLNVIEQYLSLDITPALLEQEVQRAEQWRQSLTLQSQELGRRSLEMEARRDQIQELEENLKQDRKQLELLAAETEARREQIQLAEENLKRERNQIVEMEENLKREKKQLELLVAELKANVNHRSAG